jgi:hypothetical protein
MKPSWRSVVLGMAVILVLGCSGNGSGASYDLSGSCSGSGHNDTADTDFSLALEISQAGDELSGAGAFLFGSETEPLIVTGSLSGEHIDATIYFEGALAGEYVVIVGSVSTGNQISGTFIWYDYSDVEKYRGTFILSKG